MFLSTSSVKTYENISHLGQRLDDVFRCFARHRLLQRQQSSADGGVQPLQHLLLVRVRHRSQMNLEGLKSGGMKTNSQVNFTEFRLLWRPRSSHLSGTQDILQDLGSWRLLLLVLIQQVVLPGSFNDLRDTSTNIKSVTPSKRPGDRKSDA